MLKMIDAFSKAKEYCDVGFAVNASNLWNISATKKEDYFRTDHVKEIFI